MSKSFNKKRNSYHEENEQSKHLSKQFKRNKNRIKNEDVMYDNYLDYKIHGMNKDSY